MSLIFISSKIFLSIIGKKTTEDWIMEGIAEYEMRLRPIMTLQTNFFKSNDALLSAMKNVKGIVLAMDETGKQHTSREFSKLVYKSLEDGGSHLCFVVGGFDGLPDEIRNQYQLISLSKMTWTHQMARLLLIEQIYRASEIHKGSNYHKD
jgi:23S rRNA (pseudouridine1915-N3)-methyltransferase